jgi:hypothetical protein
MQSGGIHRMGLEHSLAVLMIARDVNGVDQIQQRRAEGQKVNPQAAPREKGFLQLQADHAADLCEPQFRHRDPSPPIKYS